MENKDNLTGLLNREAFFEQLSKSVFNANQYKTKIALLIIDIDRFSKINNLHGYERGDRALKKFAGLLSSVVRKQDYVARIGDNRFAIILDSIMNVGHAELAAHKILRLLEVPFTCEKEKLLIDCTIAVSLCPTHASNHMQLMKECESVLYEARKKNESIGISVIPDEDFLSDDWDIEIAIEDAFHNDEFIVYYQPQISLDSGGVIGAEALLRWKHPVKGFISPAYFIPVAERMGLIKPITNWIINNVFRHSTDWTEKWGHLSVSVNIPPDFILQPDLKDYIANAMNLWGSEKIQLVLEIIERSLVLEPERCFSILKDLQGMGVNISIDDFGTGYSSLSYFETLPVNELKIDQSFIRNVVTSEASQNIVRLVIDLAHAFDMEVVAEGVEDLASLEFLRKYGCDIVQGYYYAKPMPNTEFKEWLLGFAGNQA